MDDNRKEEGEEKVKGKGKGKSVAWHGVFESPKMGQALAVWGKGGESIFT